MLSNLTLQRRMLISFVFQGAIVLIIGLVGWVGVSQLSDNIEAFSGNHIPSIGAVWSINEGQTQIQSAERLLFDPRVTSDERRNALNQINLGWKQIEQGFKIYDATPITTEEREKYNRFKQDLNTWRLAHERFLQIEQEYNALGIRNPWARQAELIVQGKQNSPEMTKANMALALRGRMDSEGATKEEPLFKVADEEADIMLKFNDSLIAKTQNKVAQSITQISVLLLTGVVLGFLTAVLFGIYFRNTIARPLETQVQQSGIQITTSTTQIAASGKQLEATMTEQVASTNEVVATAREIAATSGQLVKTMDEVAGMAQTTTSAASGGQKDLARMETTMRQLVQATNGISSKLGVISEKANNINTVVTTITKVADQTNLLSLNAAIEAEKAGEYGLGFSVVAREIRRLADQTAIATLDIEQMVKEMQSAVATGVMEMDKFTKEVSRSVEDVGNVSIQIAQIIEQVQALTPRFEVVNQGMEAQSQGAGQISEAMIQLSESSSQTADSLREINRAIEQLNDAALGLRRQILALR